MDRDPDANSTNSLDPDLHSKESRSATLWAFNETMSLYSC